MSANYPMTDDHNLEGRAADLNVAVDHIAVSDQAEPRWLDLDVFLADTVMDTRDLLARERRPDRLIDEP